MQLISDEDKHKTGRTSKQSDIVKHKCPGPLTGFVNVGGQKLEVRAPYAAQRYGLPDGFAFVNRYGSDNCGICGASLTDDSQNWEPISDKEFFILTAGHKEGAEQ